MQRHTNSTFLQLPGTESERVVTAAETAPASASEAVACQNFRWAYVRVDQLTAVGSGTLSIYLAANADETPTLYDTEALSTTASLDIPVNVAGVELIAVRVTAFTGTSVRVLVRLSNHGPTS